MNEKNTKNGIKPRLAKECAYIAVFLAVLMALQLSLSFVAGVEVVTALFIVYAFVFGYKRGVIVATLFTLLRQFLFGFFPSVLIVYLIYYNLVAVLFGVLGKRLKEGKEWKTLLLIGALAGVCTVCFTLLDDVVTPLVLGYTKQTAKIYFYTSLPVMAWHVPCVTLSTVLIFTPLKKVFFLVKKGLY